MYPLFSLDQWFSKWPEWPPWGRFNGQCMEKNRG